MAVRLLARYSARMSDENDERPAIYGSWHWPRFSRDPSAPVVTQEHEAGCGAACAVMLLADRGLAVELSDVERGLEMPSNHEALAARLSELSGYRWTGGALGGEPRVDWALLDRLTEAAGTWAALLEPLGLGAVGHWVVVDGVSDDGLVLIRDPKGEAYGMTVNDFALVWGYTVLVFQRA